MTVTIDTQHPSVVAGSSSERGPLDSVPLAFSEAINPATLTTSAVTVTGPGNVIDPVALIQGSGTTYTLDFEDPLVAGGTYTVAVGSGVADAAGNAVAPPTSESFTLVPDTTPPTVASVSPSGDVSTAVSSLTVNFDKAVIPGTFTGSEVTITGPNGAIPTGSIAVTEVNASDYTVTFPQQTQEATYAVSIGGTGVQDVSGVGMTAPYLTSFIIDLTAPSVVSVTPTGTVNAVVSTVDVTFSKPMDVSTLDATNVTLTGPGGAVAVGQGYLISGSTYAIPFSTQRADGAYQLTIGAGVEDAGGHPLTGSPLPGDVHAGAARPDRGRGHAIGHLGALRRHDHRGLDRGQRRQRRRDRSVDRRRLPVDDGDARVRRDLRRVVRRGGRRHAGPDDLVQRPGDRPAPERPVAGRRHLLCHRARRCRRRGE